MIDITPLMNQRLNNLIKLGFDVLSKMFVSSCPRPRKRLNSHTPVQKVFVIKRSGQHGLGKPLVDFPLAPSDS